MTIEILCSGCDDCKIIVGKVCQALADLNLNADVISVFDPHRIKRYCLTGSTGIVVNGQPVAITDCCTVRELKHLLVERVC